MTWIPTEKEVQAVLLLDGKQRYRYCLKKLADQQQLWSLRQNQRWVLASDDMGHELVPVWPHQTFASRCTSGAWTGSVPETISLMEWLTRWLPGMNKDGRLVAVFPSPNDKGIAVAPDEMESDLRVELSKYE